MDVGTFTQCTFYNANNSNYRRSVANALAKKSEDMDNTYKQSKWRRVLFGKVHPHHTVSNNYFEVLPHITSLHSVNSKTAIGSKSFVGIDEWDWLCSRTLHS